MPDAPRETSASSFFHSSKIPKACGLYAIPTRLKLEFFGPKSCYCHLMVSSCFPSSLLSPVSRFLPAKRQKIKESAHRVHNHPLIMGQWLQGKGNGRRLYKGYMGYIVKTEIRSFSQKTLDLLKSYTKGWWYTYFCSNEVSGTTTTSTKLLLLHNWSPNS